LSYAIVLPLSRASAGALLMLLAANCTSFWMLTLNQEMAMPQGLKGNAARPE
jgi:hypothetical protein